MNILNIKNDFPIFSNKYNDTQLIYFDNAATTQKPKFVIDAITKFYSSQNANIYRGVYDLSEKATQLFENSRKKIANFINAQPKEIIFTSGATAAINLVALAWAKKNINAGDEILISAMEHHSNLVVWQELVKSNNAILKVIPINKDYMLDIEQYKKLLSSKTKLVSIAHVSNVLGTTNDVTLITKLAHNYNAKVLIDAAQSVGYQKVDVKDIDCDFLAFSGHKMLGPTGIGILYVKESIYNEMEAITFGGGMVLNTNTDHSTYTVPPSKFEAGTPPIAQVIGLAAAIDYINDNIDLDFLQKYNANLCEMLINELQNIEQIKIIGPLAQLKTHGHIVCFTIDGWHPHDVASYLDQFGICVRAGHHCAQPLHKALEIDSTLRVSFYGYNQPSEIEFFIGCLKKLLKS